MGLIAHYSFKFWTGWDNQISEGVQDFKLTKGVYPNLILVNSHTYGQLNFMINVIPGAKENAFTEWDDEIREQIDDQAEAQLSQFDGGAYVLTFDLAEHLPDKTFALIYNENEDNDQIRDGLPDPELEVRVRERIL